MIHNHRDILISKLRENPFKIWFDEVAYRYGRKFLSIFAKILNGFENEPRILDLIEVTESTAEKLASFIQMRVDTLFQDLYDTANFRVLTSDGANTCLAVGKILKRTFPNLIHAICFAHNLNLVAEELKF